MTKSRYVVEYDKDWDSGLHAVDILDTKNGLNRRVLPGLIGGYPLEDVVLEGLAVVLNKLDEIEKRLNDNESN